MAKKSKITIGDLAKMMQGGFRAVAKKMNAGFQDVDKRMNLGFQDVDKRFDKKIEDLAMMVQSGFEDARIETDKRFSKIEDWQHLADGKFDVIEHELISIKHDLENVIHINEFESLRERVERMEVVLGSKKK